MRARWPRGAALLRSATATCGAAAGAAGLGGLALDQAARADLLSAGGLEAGVLVAVLGAGAVAATALALGCALVLTSHLAQLLGRRARVAERLGARLTPAILRRVLAAGVGGALLASPAAAATDGPATGPDLGWTVTTSAPGPAAPHAAHHAPQHAGPALDPALGAPPVTPVGTSPAPAGTTVAVDVTAPAPPQVAAPVAPPPAPGAAPGATPTSASVPGSAAQEAGHLVQPGDTLWAIARDHLPAGASDADVAATWPAWYAANTDVVGPDPDLIHPGQHLRAPADPTVPHEEQP